jgi:hypothetical protein
MYYDQKYAAILKAMEMTLKGNRYLISSSLIPDNDVKEDYLVEDFPTWLYGWGCKDRGNHQEATRVHKVLKLFKNAAIYCPKGDMETSIQKHGYASNGDILYVIHALKNLDFELVRHIVKDFC